MERSGGGYMSDQLAPSPETTIRIMAQQSPPGFPQRAGESWQLRFMHLFADLMHLLFVGLSTHVSGHFFSLVLVDVADTNPARHEFTWYYLWMGPLIYVLLALLSKCVKRMMADTDGGSY